MSRLPIQLTAHPYCALWRNICFHRCILCPLLPNDIRVLFHEKALFLRFSFSFTSLIPCLLPPREEREKTERTTAQLPANKKCCLLIFAIAIGCLVLADFPASSLPVTLVHPVLPFPFLLAVLLCGVPKTLVAFWGALCASAREKSLYPLKKSHQNAIFLAFLQKLLYLCTRKLNAGV